MELEGSTTYLYVHAMLLKLVNEVYAMLPYNHIAYPTLLSTVP